MPEGSSQPLLGFPIEGSDWSDGWQRSKLHDAAWPWSTAEEEEEECFAAVEAASLSCTTTGDRLIRCGSDRGSGESDAGKSTGLFRILIGAKQNKRKKNTAHHEIHSPKPILKFQISNKNKIERETRKGIHKPIHCYCIYMPLQRPRKKNYAFINSFPLSFYLSTFTHKRIPTLSLSLSISIYLHIYCFH